ncbi:hypothetical protein [Clostridium sp. YIM B02555]|uniref:hypothetical protein n=1 Tax=Clostridium sp. YIM B02555 TaxID=2911968 RepID=UPI001EEDE53F|nr:hypothetical protein [Clostridium sp. YIM B02555]
MNNTIKIAALDSEDFDKKQIALAIRNSTLNDVLNCSLKAESIIAACEHCSLKLICDGIDKLSDEYIAKTSSVIKNFSL